MKDSMYGLRFTMLIFIQYARTPIDDPTVWYTLGMVVGCHSVLISFLEVTNNPIQ